MKSFLESLFGGKQEPPKNQKRADPVHQKVGKGEDPGFYKTGDVIGGKYEILGTLGKGGFGVVYLVHARDADSVCALKTFRDELLTDPAARQAFKNEALLWVNLERHPYILAATWVEEVAGRLFVAMEHIGPDAQGRVSLADHLEGAHAPLDSKQTVKWAIEFCLGMEHAGARGIECHRDIKPANILITQDGTLKIGDFGLAAAAEVAWVGSSGRGGSFVTGGPEAGFGFSLIQTEGKMRCGTPGYIAPEGYRFEGGDIRSDIYSFGLVLWQVAAGSRLPPWTVQWRGDMENYLRGIYEQQMVANVPHTEGPLGSVIKRCLRPRPSERYGSFQELRATLEPIWNSITGRDFESPAKEQQTRAFWNNKGNALHALGRYEEAIICLDRALAIDPQSAPAWSNKGNAFRALGRHAEAIACYDKALTISPQSAIPWDNKGVVLDTLGRGEEALRCYDRALAIDPRFTSTWNNKGVALNLLGRHIEAIACFEKALEIDPRHANAWYVKALTEDRVGQSGAALKSYRRFVELAPPQDVRGIARARQRVQELESKGV